MKKRSSFSSLLLILVYFILSTTASWACGGLFCNTTQPVVQSAERILFTYDPVDSSRLQMHVQIQYAGPPADFSWMLPVPANTDFKLSTERLFTLLDSTYAPIFQLNRERVGDCPLSPSFDSAGGYYNETASPAPPNEPNGPRVQVLSREIVGPYDKVLLTADTVEVLTDWLTENGYQVPPRADEVLSPYLDGFAFIAIKLIPTEGVDSIRPIALTMSSPAPAIPIIPTSVAAQPDMGILVHFLGESRAVSTNYAHVQINEAVLDWQNAGSNYTDVVSQAVDEADGQAFVTDFAGTHNQESPFPEISDARLLAIEEVTTIQQMIEAEVHLYLGQVDYDSAIRDTVDLSDEEWQELTQCANFIDFITQFPGQEQSQPEETERCTTLINNDERIIDGAAIAAALSPISLLYGNLNQVFEAHPYLTRLYSTLSADEMTVDPSFTFNQDLEDVDQTRTAILRTTCEGESLELELTNGLIIDLRNEENQPEMIERQDGETVRGMGEIAASIIERQMPAGQSMVIDDRNEDIQFKTVTSTDESGCQTSTRSLGMMPLWMLILFALYHRTRKSNRTRV
jgi:hypothetical protein